MSESAAERLHGQGFLGVFVITSDERLLAYYIIKSWS